MKPESYNPSEIAPRWQARWEELGLHKTNLDDDSRPPYYVLTMYDYPSGDLHIGHWFTKAPSDGISRFQRTRGYSVPSRLRPPKAGAKAAAAALAAKLGTKAEIARELAYRLYTLCERKKRAQEALSYNGLVQSWPEITRLAREGGKPRETQITMFDNSEG